MNENILIIGAGVAGKLLIQSIYASEIEANIIGVLDDSAKEGEIIEKDIKVLGVIESLPEILETYKVDKIIIAIPSERGSLIRKILLLVGDNYTQGIYIVPRVSEIVFTAKVSYSDIRPIEPVDIVGEMIVKQDQEKLANQFKEQTVLVTGGGGSIGSELSKQIFLLKPKKLIILDFSERNIFWIDLVLKKLAYLNPETEIEIILGNVTNQSLLRRIFKENHITSIFHAAAYKHVPVLENQLYEAINNNVLSTYLLANLANEYNVKKFILISTDKAVKPVNTMGRTKKLAEKIVSYFDNKNTETIYSAVRFGNVFNSSGSAVEIFLHQIEKEEKITITDPEMTRFFMTIPEAVHLVLQAWNLSKDGNFYMLEMGDPINIYELAKCLVILKRRKLSTFKFEVVGARPGEKKHEELINETEEQRDKTSHPRIYAVSNKLGNNYDEFFPKLENIIEDLSLENCQNHSKDGNDLLKSKLQDLT